MLPLNIANLLTLLRIVLIPVLVVVFYSRIPHQHHIAAAIFAAAAITDWLDGYLARKYQLESALGAFLDPVADKLMVATVLLLLVQAKPEPWLAIVAAIIISREISISALREWMAEIGQRAKVKVAVTGKIKTVAQMTALALMLYRDPVWFFPTTLVGEVCLIVAAVLTIWSAVQYLLAARVALRQIEKPQTQKS